MKLAALPERELRTALRDGTLTLRTGPFVIRVRSIAAPVVRGLALMYGDYTLAMGVPFADYHVSVMPPGGLRRWVRPKVNFSMDGRGPFQPLPAAQAFPMLEWGLNWCISTTAHQYLLIHSAVVERNGRACLLPAPPGSGKSTLCAALVNRGWRLFSDEMALVRPSDGRLVPMPRPVSLKNDSIDVIRAFAPDAVVGPPTHDTGKGTVAHMGPDANSVDRASESAAPGWVVFPRYVPGMPADLRRRERGGAFMFLADNAFNYSTLGARGFHVLCDLIDASNCYDFSYGDLDEAVDVFERLAAAPPAPGGTGT